MKYIEVPLVVRPGIPNSNNVVYDEKILREAFDRRKNQLSSMYPGIPITDDVAEDTVYHNVSDSVRYNSIDPMHVLGYAIEHHYDHLLVATNNEDEFKRLINLGYRAGMRYIAEVDYNKADKLSYITKINCLICYDMLINYKIIGE